MQINHDVPLNKKNALANDKLDRAKFSRSVVKVLSKVNQDCGLVISIEGKWGSGKTSTLAMIEELLENDERKPIVVHFNPWLVGDRDALLGQFLSSIAKAIKHTVYTKVGKTVAKTIEAYSDAFDIIKFIPGVEPWASIAKVVFRSVGKTPDLAGQKQKVEKALVKLKHPIIVFIDDMDRLFPKEVFEMIRIIKAVGELPNIAYVLAWDAAYIEEALKKGEVAYSTSYLDKIVQVRLNLPILSRSARRGLFYEAIATLPDEAKKSYFQEDDDRFHDLNKSSLNKLLDQPRDFSRLFNLVQIIEPQLRGNVVLADIIGLAAVALFAPPVYDLLKSEMELFTPQIISNDSKDFSEDQNSSKRKIKQEEALKSSHRPEVIRSLLEFLLPEKIEFKKIGSNPSILEAQGRISSKTRLYVALQWGTSSTEMNLTKVYDFILKPNARSEIVTTLTEENCLDFLEALNGMSHIAQDCNDSAKSNLLLTIAQLLDKEPYHSRFSNENYYLNVGESIWNTISTFATNLNPNIDDVVQLIIGNEDTLSFSSLLLNAHWIDNKRAIGYPVNVKNEHREELCDKFAENVFQKINQKKFWELTCVGEILRTATQANEELTKKIFEEIRRIDPTLDNFVMAFFKVGATTKPRGMKIVDVYGAWEKEDDVSLSKYISKDDIKIIANKRLLEPTLSAPALGAWKAVATGWRHYSDGAEVEI